MYERVQQLNIYMVVLSSHEYAVPILDIINNEMHIEWFLLDATLFSHTTNFITFCEALNFMARAPKGQSFVFC